MLTKILWWISSEHVSRKSHINFQVILTYTRGEIEFWRPGGISVVKWPKSTRPCLSEFSDINAISSGFWKKNCWNHLCPGYLPWARRRGSRHFGFFHQVGTRSFSSIGALTAEKSMFWRRTVILMSMLKNPTWPRLVDFLNINAIALPKCLKIAWTYYMKATCGRS